MSAPLVIVEETARLRLRRFTADDLDRLHELNSDPEVMRYINGGVPETRDQARASLARALAWYERGPVLGVWAAELKDCGEFIGWFCLKPMLDGSDVELGYRLLKRHWGRGYATEGAARMRERAFGPAGLSRVAAIVDPDNAASRRVIEKAGLVFEKRTTVTVPWTGQTRAVDLFGLTRINPAA